MQSSTRQCFLLFPLCAITSLLIDNLNHFHLSGFYLCLFFRECLLYLTGEIRELELLPLTCVLIFGLKGKSFFHFNGDKQIFEAQ